MNYSFSSAITPMMQSMQSVPMVGYRFHPTDEELVNHYLLEKTHGDETKVRAIAELSVCEFEPWDLPGHSKIKSKDQVWYFFCRRDYKYQKSKRINRKTKSGYWKPTGQPRKVTAKRTKKEIGTKKTLVFYKDHGKGKRTPWIMHEYDFVPGSNLHKEASYVVCKLKKKSDGKTDNSESNHCITSASDFENQNPNEMTTISACDESEPNYTKTFDFANQNPTEMTNMSSYEKGETTFEMDNCLMVSDFETQIPALEDGEYLSNATSDFENQSTYEKDDCLLASDFENQILDTEFQEGEWNFRSLVTLSVLEIQSATEKGESSRPVASVLESDISASAEAKFSCPMATCVDFKDVNSFQKNDTSTLEKVDWNSLKNFFENNEDEATLPEGDPRLEAKLFAEFEKILNSDCQPPMCTEESSSHSSSATCVSAGMGSIQGMPPCP